jgi:hypothetical protein
MRSAHVALTVDEVAVDGNRLEHEDGGLAGAPEMSTIICDLSTAIIRSSKFQQS